MAKKDKNPLAEALMAREAGDNRASVLERLATRLGGCLSASGCSCEAWETGKKDAFGWQLCECQHTQWAHEATA